MNFKQLHQQSDPLLLCNVWDAMSSNIAQQTGFKAIGTSSAAISACMGLEDGENSSFDQLLNVVTQITASSTLPLTVDIEHGYSADANLVVKNIKALKACGVVGVNIEDSNCYGGQRHLDDSDQFAQYLNNITTQLQDQAIDIFVNVRTDAFLLEHSNLVQKTLHRIKQYQAAGANGIFVPGLKKSDDITTIVNSTNLPINVMCFDGLPNFDQLQKLGVKRISMGNFLFDYAMKHFKQSLEGVIKHQSFKTIF